MKTRHSVRELITAGRARLGAAGVDTPQLDAELLLAHAIHTDRSGLLVRLSDDVPVEAQQEFDRFLDRRERREPLAYIIGVREFWGRAFAVNSNVLIPRPETELLVERALQVAPVTGGIAVDVGTGSGCVAVSVAAESSGLSLHATDTSGAALEVARRNASLHGVSGRIRFWQGSLLHPVPERVDVVLANLPYVPAGEIPALEPEVGQWEPRSALDGGPDGLDLIRTLLGQLPGAVTERAVCLLEIDPRQFEKLEAEVRLRLPGWGMQGLEDLSGRIRVAELRLLTPSL